MFGRHDGHNMVRSVSTTVPADVIKLILYLCIGNLMFVPYFGLFNIHSHMPEAENPDSYDKWEPGL